MEFRKMLMITLYAKQKKRHRFIEQSFRLCGRRRRWDVSREQHRNMYIIQGHFVFLFFFFTNLCSLLQTGTLLYYLKCTNRYMSFPDSSDGKESVCNAEDPSLILGLGRSPEEGNGYPLQYSCLENSMDRGPQQATVQGVSKS